MKIWENLSRSNNSEKKKKKRMKIHIARYLSAQIVITKKFIQKIQFYDTSAQEVGSFLILAVCRCHMYTFIYIYFLRYMSFLNYAKIARYLTHSSGSVFVCLHEWTKTTQHEWRNILQHFVAGDGNSTIHCGVVQRERMIKSYHFCMHI